MIDNSCYLYQNNDSKYNMQERKQIRDQVYNDPFVMIGIDCESDLRCKLQNCVNTQIVNLISNKVEHAITDILTTLISEDIYYTMCDYKKSI